MESIISLVAEWILVKDMSNLYELSSTVSCGLQAWVDDQILDSFCEQTWIDMSKEWTEFMCATTKNRQGGQVEKMETKERSWLKVHVLLWEQVRTGAIEALCEIRDAPVSALARNEGRDQDD